MQRELLTGKLDTDPTPEEIAHRAAEIRASWDVAEELKRREPLTLPWTVPAVGARIGAANNVLRRWRPVDTAQ